MKRSPAAAVWLSLLPGLGHIFIGQATKGFAYALMTVGLIYIVEQADGPLGILIPIFWVFVMLDAHRSAVETNRAIDAGEQGAHLETLGGTPWLGWIAVGLGIFFLFNNLFGIDFDWLWRFWPLALIVIGVKLLKGGSGSKGKVVPPAVPDRTDIETPAADEGEGDERSADD